MPSTTSFVSFNKFSSMALVKLTCSNRSEVAINTDDISSLYEDRGFSYCDYIVKLKNGDAYSLDYESYNKLLDTAQ